MQGGIRKRMIQGRTVAGEAGTHAGERSHTASLALLRLGSANGRMVAEGTTTESAAQGAQAETGRLVAYPAGVSLHPVCRGWS